MQSKVDNAISGAGSVFTYFLEASVQPSCEIDLKEIRGGTWRDAVALWKAAAMPAYTHRTARSRESTGCTGLLVCYVAMCNCGCHLVCSLSRRSRLSRHHLINRERLPSPTRRPDVLMSSRPHVPISSLCVSSCGATIRAPELSFRAQSTVKQRTC